MGAQVCLYGRPGCVVNMTRLLEMRRWSPDGGIAGTRQIVFDRALDIDRYSPGCAAEVSEPLHLLGPPTSIEWFTTECHTGFHGAGWVRNGRPCNHHRFASPYLITSKAITDPC